MLTLELQKVKDEQGTDNIKISLEDYITMNGCIIGALFVNINPKT